MTYKANNTNHQEIIKRLEIIRRIVDMCDDMIAKGNDVSTAKFHKARYEAKASALFGKLNRYPHKLNTPRPEFLTDDLTHARIAKRFDGYAIYATCDFASYVHLNTCYTRKEALDYINR